MAGRTPNFNLTTLTAGDDFSLDGHKFTDADPVLVDRLLNAALTHNHSGVAAEDLSETVDSPPVLTLDPSTGSLPAGVRFYYKVALIGEDGLPTLASPETTIDSPNPVLSPDAPTASRSATLGTLLPGTYYYRLSAYRSASTLETAAGDAVSVPLPAAAGTTQRVILTLPSMPLGGEGYNIYRRIPGGSAFLHIATIPLVDIGDDWIDDGSVAVNCERFSPSLNTTSSSNSVEIAYPGGVIPVGYTWRIYRTDVSGAWAHSHLIDVVEETTEGSGVITPVYLDLGLGTLAGSPPTTTPPPIVTPAQIDYADLIGTPPAPSSEAVVTFHVPGVVAAGIYDFMWVSPYEEARIRSVHANLGVAATPVGTDLRCTLELYHVVDADWWPVNTDFIEILIGENVATEPIPLDADNEFPQHPQTMSAGDKIRLFVDQAGGATATDLVVTLLLWVRSTAPAYEWPAP